jgi:hypothetical protein
MAILLLTIPTSTWSAKSPVAAKPQRGFTYQPSGCDGPPSSVATLGWAVQKFSNPESGCIIPFPPDRRHTISANSCNPSRTLSGFADRATLRLCVSAVKFLLLIFQAIRTPVRLDDPVVRIRLMIIHSKNPNGGFTYQPRFETLPVLRFYPGLTFPNNSPCGAHCPVRVGPPSG